MPRGYKGRDPELVNKTKRKPTGAAAMGPGPGRPKGVPNKITRDLKEALIRAANRAGGKGGLEDFLFAQAMASMNSPFMTMLAKLLPTEQKTEHTGDININVTFGE